MTKPFEELSFDEALLIGQEGFLDRLMAGTKFQSNVTVFAVEMKRNIFHRVKAEMNAATRDPNCPKTRAAAHNAHERVVKAIHPVILNGVLHGSIAEALREAMQMLEQSEREQRAAGNLL